VAILEHELGPGVRGLVSIDGPPIPMPPSLDGAAFRAAVPNLPHTALEAGIAETVRRFRDLSAAGRLDTSDIDGEPVGPTGAGTRTS
jgi:hypothetical protein